MHGSAVFLLASFFFYAQGLPTDSCGFGEKCEAEQAPALLQKTWQRAAKSVLSQEDISLPAIFELMIKEEERAEGVTAMSNGSTAPLDELGYKAVAATCCNLEMELFITRLVQDMGLTVCDFGALTAFTAFFTCEKGVQSFAELQADISTHAARKTCPWLVSAGKSCPAMGEGCGVKDPDALYHRRRVCKGKGSTTLPIGPTTTSTPSCVQSLGEVCGSADADKTMLCECDCVACATWKSETSTDTTPCSFYECLEFAGTDNLIKTCNPGLPGAVGTCDATTRGTCKIPPLPEICWQNMTRTTTPSPECTPGKSTICGSSDGGANTMLCECDCQACSAWKKALGKDDTECLFSDCVDFVGTNFMSTCDPQFPGTPGRCTVDQNQNTSGVCMPGMLPPDCQTTLTTTPPLDCTPSNKGEVCVSTDQGKTTTSCECDCAACSAWKTKNFTKNLHIADCQFADCLDFGGIDMQKCSPAWPGAAGTCSTPINMNQSSYCQVKLPEGCTTTTTTTTTVDCTPLSTGEVCVSTDSGKTSSLCACDCLACSAWKTNNFTGNLARKDCQFADCLDFGGIDIQTCSPAWPGAAGTCATPINLNTSSYCHIPLPEGCTTTTTTMTTTTVTTTTTTTTTRPPITCDFDETNTTQGLCISLGETSTWGPCDCARCSAWKMSLRAPGGWGNDTLCSFPDCMDFDGRFGGFDATLASPPWPGEKGFCVAPGTSYMYNRCEIPIDDGCKEKVQVEEPAKKVCPAKEEYFGCQGTSCVPLDMVDYVRDYYKKPWCLEEDDDMCTQPDKSWCSGACQCPTACANACGRCPTTLTTTTTMPPINCETEPLDEKCNEKTFAYAPDKFDKKCNASYWKWQERECQGVQCLFDMKASTRWTALYTQDYYKNYWCLEHDHEFCQQPDKAFCKGNCTYVIGCPHACGRCKGLVDVY